MSTRGAGADELLGGEVAALRDGGDVGPVNSEDAVEDVAGLGDVVRSVMTQAGSPRGHG